MRLTAWPPPPAMTKTSLQEWISQTRQQLAPVREFAALETYALAALVLHQPREWLITHGDTPLSDEQLQQLEQKIGQLKSGIPLPYLTGKQAFYGLDFIVTPDVLIPRPETELLVEEAIAWLEARPDARTMIDVGTGSGIIPIALADHIPDLTATALDLSGAALAVAEENIRRFSLLERITTLQDDLLGETALQAHLITANLPYIPSARLQALEVTAHEPRLALDGGADGFSLIRRLLAQLPAHLLQGGLALLEIDCTHAAIAITEATKVLTSAKISVLNDLAGLPRVLKIQT